MPWSSERCTGGGAIVLSTTVNGPAIAPSASRSTMSMPAGADDATHTVSVWPGLIALTTFGGSVASTNDTSMLSRGHSIVNNWCVTENVFAWATMWSPAPQNVNTTDAIAPMPEPNASAASAPSSAATA